VSTRSGCRRTVLSMTFRVARFEDTDDDFTALAARTGRAYEGTAGTVHAERATLAHCRSTHQSEPLA
jgi:hypothetical protein